VEVREFEYLTFDCYGTLIDWKKGIIDSIEKAAGRLPLPADRVMEAYVAAEKKQEGEYKKYREVLKGTFENLVGEVGLSVPKGASERFAGSVPKWPAFQDTAATLRRLGQLGYKRYILSNVDNDLLLGTISRNGLEVDGTVTAEDVGSYKPSPGHWVKFLEKTGAKKERVLHAAQSIYHDVLPTRVLGIASAWVNRYAEPLPPGVEPAYISDSLGNLAKMLE
jgi:2-haloalkanoic acid dehalogenase type II